MGTLLISRRVGPLIGTPVVLARTRTLIVAERVVVGAPMPRIVDSSISGGVAALLGRMPGPLRIGCARFVAGRGITVGTGPGIVLTCATWRFGCIVSTGWCLTAGGSGFAW